MGRDQRRGRRKDCRVGKRRVEEGHVGAGPRRRKKKLASEGPTPTSRAAPNRTDLGSVVCKCIDSTDRSKRRYQVARLGPLVWNSVASNFHDRDELQSCGCVIAFDLPPPSNLDGPKRAHPDHTFHCCTPCRPLGGGCHSAGGHQALAPPPPSPSARHWPTDARAAPGPSPPPICGTQTGASPWAVAGCVAAGGRWAAPRRCAALQLPFEVGPACGTPLLPRHWRAHTRRMGGSGALCGLHPTLGRRKRL